MNKIKISENELVTLIEKLVKENLGNGNGHNFGLMGTPTSKYKDLYELDDVEGEVDEETLNLNVDSETQDGLDQESAMEGIKEQKIAEDNKSKYGFGFPTLIGKVKKAIKAMMDGDYALTAAELTTLGLLISLGPTALSLLGISNTTLRLWKSIEKGTYKPKEKEKVTEAKIVSRLKKKLIKEQKGKGCADKDAGCIRTHGDGFRILNNKVGGWFKSKKGDVYDYKTRADAKAALAIMHM